MNAFELLFWSSVGLTAYTYVGYPVLIRVLARLFPQRSSRSMSDRAPRPGVAGSDSLPFVSLVIAAYREESVILERLNNAMQLDWPADRLEVLIGCDGDEDLTGELVRAFGDSRVKLLQYPRRRGKASVLNDTIPQARGEIVVLSDANTMMQPDAIRQLARHFEDPEVGGVCGRLVLVDSLSGQNVDGLYWKYENYLKQQEGRFGAVLGVNGAIYAMRKELYQPIPANTIIDDFLIGMRIHRTGHTLLYDETAVAIEETPPHIRDEFHRRSRIGAGGFQSLMWLWPLLSPMHGKVAFALWSHKVLRWFCPAFLLTAMFSNVVLAGDPFYLRVLLVHEMFYLVALAGMLWLQGHRAARWLRLPAMFVSMNAALAVGFWRWLSGIRGGTWKRTERSAEQAVNSAAITAAEDAPDGEETVLAADAASLRSLDDSGLLETAGTAEGGR